MVNRSSCNRAMAYGVLLLSAILLGGCEGLTVHDVSSLLVPDFQRSEVIGFVAGLGTTFAAVPDLLGMVRRRSSKGINPTMAADGGGIPTLRPPRGSRRRVKASVVGGRVATWELVLCQRG
jgi:hypothetical protein